MHEKQHTQLQLDAHTQTMPQKSKQFGPLSDDGTNFTSNGVCVQSMDQQNPIYLIN